MAREWKVTTERLDASANSIEEKTAKYNREWAKLYTEIQSLKATHWQGIASETFNSKLEGYRGDFEEMAQLLMKYAEFLRTVADNYEKTENAIKAAADSIKIG